MVNMWFAFKIWRINEYNYFVFRYDEWNKFVDKINYWDRRLDGLHARNVLLVPFKANSELEAYLKAKELF
jgi:hypothetical protein